MRVAVALMALALAACGSSPEDKAESAVRSYVEAFSAGDHGRACELLSDAGQVRLEEEVIGQLPDQASEAVLCRDYSALLFAHTAEADRAALADGEADPLDVDVAGDGGKVQLESGTFGVEEVNGDYLVSDPRPVALYATVPEGRAADGGPSDPVGDCVLRGGTRAECEASGGGAG